MWQSSASSSSERSRPSIQAANPHQVDSPYAAMRLFITLILMIVGASGMYVMDPDGSNIQPMINIKSLGTLEWLP